MNTCAGLCLVTQCCLTLWDPMNCSLLGLSVYGDSPGKILEWVAMPSSRGSFPPRDGTRISCIAGRFFTIWATREDPVRGYRTCPKWFSDTKVHSVFKDLSQNVLIIGVCVQDWFPLGLTGWIPLQSKGLSRVFSNTTVQKHQFFSAQPFLLTNSHIYTWLLEKP